MTRKEYATVKEMVNHFPCLTMGGLRHMIFQNTNGIHECMLKVGKKIYFDIEKFQNWMDKQTVEK